MTTDANTPADTAATVAALRASQLAHTHDELIAALNVANRMRQRALRAESALDSAAGAALNDSRRGIPHQPYASAVDVTDAGTATWLTYRDGSRLQLPASGPAVVHPPLPDTTAR